MLLEGLHAFKWDRGMEKPQGWVKPCPVPFFLSFPLPPASVGPREDTVVRKGQHGILFLVSGQWAPPQQERGLESLFLKQ